MSVYLLYCLFCLFFFFFKQKTAYEMRISDWSSDVCSSDLDAVGNVLSDGDSVALVKDLQVKGAGQTLKVGTVIKSIRLTGDAQEIDCRHDGIKGLVLRAEFVRKR